MVVTKKELEVRLKAEKEQISEGRLKDENPLDESTNFKLLCEACRLGDISCCREMISEGANVNGRDAFDYTPLILASLCGHYEVVQLLLESGSVCQRDTFQGERCLYNALNDRIRNLLLRYEYSKITHPLQPFAAHVTSLLSREHPNTWDITLNCSAKAFRLHKFILAVRSPFFRRKLPLAAGVEVWKLPHHITSQAAETAIRYLYLGELPADLEGGGQSGASDQDGIAAVERLSRLLEMEKLWEDVLEGGDRRIARQRHDDEIARCREQFEDWYRENVLKYKIKIETSKAGQVRWSRENSIFADVLLCAGDDVDEDEEEAHENEIRPTSADIPIGPVSTPSRSPSRTRRPRTSVLYPVHRAMLIRSEFFLAMFSSTFKEAQHTEYLQIIPIDCTSDVLEVVLEYLYTEHAAIPVDIAIDVLLAADLLLLEKLKTKAAAVISTSGNTSRFSSDRMAFKSGGRAGANAEDMEINIYEVIRVGWLTRMRRLDEFGARYLAWRLEDYIDEEEFADLIRESAASIKERQQTDTIELLDDIRYYLSERFRLRFEDVGLEELMDEQYESTNNPIRNVDQDGIEELALNNAAHYNTKTDPSVGIDSTKSSSSEPRTDEHSLRGQTRTLDGEIVDDEFLADAINYRVLLEKIDRLLEKLKLDA